MATIGAIGASFFGRKRTQPLKAVAVGQLAAHAGYDALVARYHAGLSAADVSDSPAGRMDYVNAFGKRLSVAANGRSMGVASFVGRRRRSGERRVSESAGSVALPSMGVPRAWASFPRATAKSRQVHVRQRVQAVVLSQGRAHQRREEQCGHAHGGRAVAQDLLWSHGAQYEQGEQPRDEEQHFGVVQSALVAVHLGGG